jgi:hypothetical protein
MHPGIGLNPALTRRKVAAKMPGNALQTRHFTVAALVRSLDGVAVTRIWLRGGGCGRRALMSLVDLSGDRGR